MEDENFVLSIKDWAKKTVKSKYSGKYILISNINIRLDITLYALTQFVGKYLRLHKPELARNKIKTQEKLEKAILCGSTTLYTRTFNCRARICSKTARKWLNCLGYK